MKSSRQKDLFDIRACPRVLAMPLPQQYYASQCNSSPVALSTSVPEPKVQGCTEWALRYREAVWQKDGSWKTIPWLLSWLQQKVWRIGAETGGLDEKLGCSGSTDEKNQKRMSCQREHIVIYTVWIHTIFQCMAWCSGLVQHCIMQNNTLEVERALEAIYSHPLILQMTKARPRNQTAS